MLNICLGNIEQDHSSYDVCIFCLTNKIIIE